MASVTATLEQAIPSTPQTKAERPSALVHFSKDADPAEIARIIQRDGGCILQGVVTPEQVNSFNQEVDPIMKDRPKIADASIPDALKAFQGSNTKRIHGLTNISKTFREHILDNDLLHGISEEIIGKNIGSYWLSTAQLMEIGPGQKAQPLHRDGGGWWPFFRMGTASPIAYVNFLIAMTDTTRENGATRFIPGSHNWPFTEDYANTGSVDMTEDVELKAGDVLVITDRLVHGGGENSTKDFLRRVIAFSVTTSAYTPEEAHTLFVDLPLVKTLSPRAQRFLGFRSQYPRGSPGVMTWNVEEIAPYLGLDEPASKPVQ